MGWLRKPGLVLAALAACTLSGCLAFYSTRPVEVLVTRENSLEPVADLPVSVTYMGMLILNTPKQVAGKTDEQGKAVLPLADFDDGLILLQAGNNRFYLAPDIIRKGGTLTKGEPVFGTDGRPPVSIKLIARPCSFFQRFFSLAP